MPTDKEGGQLGFVVGRDEMKILEPTHIIRGGALLEGLDIAIGSGYAQSNFFAVKTDQTTKYRGRERPIFECAEDGIVVYRDGRSAQMKPGDRFLVLSSFCRTIK